MNDVVEANYAFLRMSRAKFPVLRSSLGCILKAFACTSERIRGALGPCVRRLDVGTQILSRVHAHVEEDVLDAARACGISPDDGVGCEP